ncbi:hypothetical protein [Pseudomonas sp. TH31]|uniref:hypothetical protein n=1 Tax=Pseudomonas sp. TH31 TaxID=2796396 RepID=UPI001A924331|nr:hypothetical protein [Pseudomonas sp. TH31]
MTKEPDTEKSTQETPTPPSEPSSPATANVIVSFSDVAVKKDGTYVVTVAGNRCHVTKGYNAPLYKAVRVYLKAGGDFTEYAEDIIVESDPLMLARLWVEMNLQKSESIVSQYRDARDLGEDPPITPDQFTALLMWRKAVREWPKEKDYPAESGQPSVPDWLKPVLQNDD